MALVVMGSIVVASLAISIAVRRAEGVSDIFLIVAVAAIVSGAIYLRFVVWKVSAIEIAADWAGKVPVSNGFSAASMTSVPSARFDVAVITKHKTSLSLFVLLVGATLVLTRYEFTAAASLFLSLPLGILISAVVVWGLLIPQLYIKPEQVAVLKRAHPGASVWLNSTTAGLRAYFASLATNSTLRLKSSTFLVSFHGVLQVWQKQDRALRKMLDIPEDQITAAVAQDVSFATDMQPGLMLTIDSGRSGVVHIPLIPAIGRLE